MEKRNGGAGLIDLTAKDKSLKASWINIIQNEEKLQKICYANFAPELKELIWKCSLDPLEIRTNIKDPFWGEVMEA